VLLAGQLDEANDEFPPSDEVSASLEADDSPDDEDDSPPPPPPPLQERTRRLK